MSYGVSSNDKKVPHLNNEEITDQEREEGIVRLLSEAYFEYCKKHVEHIGREKDELSNDTYEFME